MLTITNDVEHELTCNKNYLFKESNVPELLLNIK